MRLGGSDNSPELSTPSRTSPGRATDKEVWVVAFAAAGPRYATSFDPSETPMVLLQRRYDADCRGTSSTSDCLHRWTIPHFAAVELGSQISDINRAGEIAEDALRQFFIPDDLSAARITLAIITQRDDDYSTFRDGQPGSETNDDACNAITVFAMADVPKLKPELGAEHRFGWHDLKIACRTPIPLLSPGQSECLTDLAADAKVRRLLGRLAGSAVEQEPQEMRS